MKFFKEQGMKMFAFTSNHHEGFSIPPQVTGGG